MAVALVTGAAKGIGAAVAYRLAAQFDALVLMDVDGDGLEKTAEHLKSQARTEIVVGSVASADDCRRAVKAAQALGDLAGLSHNAGIQRYGTVETTTEAGGTRSCSVNLKSVFLVCQQPCRCSGPRKGAIVNMASVQSFATQKGVVAYTTGKHALIGLVTRHGARLRSLWRPRQRGRAGQRRYADAALGGRPGPTIPTR